MNTRIAAFLGLLLLLVISAWLGLSFHSKQTQKELSKKWDEHFDSFEEFARRFPKQSANRSALELEKLSANLGINFAPKEFNNRVHITEEKYNLINRVNKDAAKVLASWLTHERSEWIEMPSELREFLNSNQQALQDIVSRTIQSEPPVWELNIERHIHAPLPNLSGQMTLQRLINLRASLLIEESKYVEAEKMLEASWKINEQLLNRPEEITYMIWQNILRLQQWNLRQIQVSEEVWYERLQNPEIERQLWKILEGNVWAMLKASDQGALLKDEKETRSTFHVLSPYMHLMVLDWADVMHSRIVELSKRDPCSPMKPIKIGEEKRLFAKWNRMGPIMFDDPANLWNRSMRFLLELELTNKILEINQTRDSLDEVLSLDSKICKGEKWNYAKTRDGFDLTFSKEIDWSIADFSKTTFFLPDKYTSKKDSANSALKTNVHQD